ncbi:MAG: ABC-F family ATP-binding cassette domain-containing protein [Clostridia bacterium]|jgi:ATP-binding cassette subfamily F protein 3|nr:ABC-F family ATP-binding cassette domain-containing protein [Clostridia bacterium]
MLIHLDNVTFGYNGFPILENVCFMLSEQERVGLVGGNGEGKTTLLRLCLGMLSPDSGSVTRKNGIRIGYLDQSGGFESDATVYGAMAEVFEEDRQLIDRLRETERQMADANEDEMRILAARCESYHKRIAARDSYSYEVRIKTVLGGMGFGAVYDQKVNTMSGGEKTRLKLCRLLLEAPDLLVLDEPTNHLDIKTLFFLEDYLTSYRGALFIVSHDRFFLDRITSRTLDLEHGRVVSYQGNYSKYKILKAEHLTRQEKEYEKQQEEIARLKEYVDKNIVRATTAKSAQSRVKQLDRMELIEKPIPPPARPVFSFSYDERPYERVIYAPAFDLKIDGKILLRSAEFTLMRGEKCAILGDNGTGKSTFLKYLLSNNPTVQYGRFARTAYYDQENADLDPEDRVLDAFWGKYALLSQTDARKLLARSGLSADDVCKKVKELSGGLKAKLELSLLEARRANVLLLDEPTNHLDLPAREALEEALKTFDGTVLFVSHDRRFIEQIATRIVILENGTLNCFSGTYAEYLEAKSSVPQTEPPKKTKTADSSYRTKEDRAREAKRKTRTREIETRLEQIETERETLNSELIASAADYISVQKITTRLTELQTEEDALYAEYETLI